MTTSFPIVLASGAITTADTLRVELHRPSDSPAFILLRWPAAPSVTVANPKVLATIAASIVRVMAEAQAQLANIRPRKER